MNNSNYYKSHWPNIISGYSDNIAEYWGRGKIALKNKDELDCEFKIIQTREGTILSLCSLIIRDTKLFPMGNNFNISALSGETIEGYKILTDGPITLRDSHFSSSYECQIVFLIRSLEVKIKDNLDLETISFGITNFEFDSNCWIDEIPSPEIIIPRQVKAIVPNLQNQEILIRQILEYEKTIEKIKTFKTIDVTCEASMALSKRDEIEKKQAMIDNLCYLMSVARGTKINWIYYKLHKGKDLISMVHQNRITKEFNWQCADNSVN